VLTGGAYLHVAAHAPAFFGDHAEQAMALFASTSPSYLILESLDAANRYLAEGYRERLRSFAQIVADLKERLTAYGYPLIGDEPLKLTLAPKPLGYTGEDLTALLREEKIVCEFYDRDFVTLMLTPELPTEELSRLERILTELPRRSPILDEPPLPQPRERVLSLNEALYAPTRLLPVEECEGKILAEARVACPPAIPIAVCGERMDEDAIRCMKYYGVDFCRIVEEDL